MRYRNKKRSGYIISLCFVMLAFTFASFQTFSNPTIAKRAAVSAPHGTYRNTCRNIHVKRHHIVYYNLLATCQNNHGRWVHAKLKKFRRCRGNIANHNGHLRCVARRHSAPVHSAPAHRPVVHIPPGTYKHSCRNIHVRGRNLVASCNDAHGHWKHTTLHDYSLCHGNISNAGGRLHCNRRQPAHHAPVHVPAPHIPAGSYRHSCRNIRVHKHVLRASCRTHNRHWRHTRLYNFGRCHGGIENHNGRLRCIR